MLLTPGFVTDVLGFLLVVPMTRPMFRRALARLVARRARVVTRRARVDISRGGGTPTHPAQAGRPGAGPTRDPRVVPGEVIDGDEPGRPG